MLTHFLSSPSPPLRDAFLQVVYNNRGWRAPKMSALAVHPDGFASRSNDIGVAFDPPPDYSGIAAAAGGAFSRKVERAETSREPSPKPSGSCAKKIAPPCPTSGSPTFERLTRASSACRPKPLRHPHAKMKSDESMSPKLATFVSSKLPVP